MMTLLGLSGSLRAASFNTALLRAASQLMPEGAHLTLKTIHGIPLYDGDLEAEQGIPEVVRKLGREIASADGLIIATPEYNHSIPGPLKNAIDWLSRLDDAPKPVFSGKSVAVIGASPGGFGTALAQCAWLAVLRALEADLWTGGRLLVSHAGKVFAPDGTLSDERTSSSLRQFLQSYLNFLKMARQS